MGRERRRDRREYRRHEVTPEDLVEYRKIEERGMKVGRLTQVEDCDPVEHLGGEPERPPRLHDNDR